MVLNLELWRQGARLKLKGVPVALPHGAKWELSGGVWCGQ